MWYRTGPLFLCILLWFICSSVAVCQTHQAAPIKGFFSADSVKAQATTVQGLLRPVRRDPAPINPGRSSSENHQVQVSLVSATDTAPWARFHLSATQAQWNIRKPGQYKAELIVGSITSNVDILINFSGFEDLTSTNSPTQSVETYYGVSIGNQSVQQADWVRASDFNARTLLIEQNPTTPTYWSLCNKVYVKRGNSAFEYSDDAVITFAMQNAGPWIDSELPQDRKK